MNYTSKDYKHKTDGYFKGKCIFYLKFSARRQVCLWGESESDSASFSNMISIRLFVHDRRRAAVIDKVPFANFASHLFVHCIQATALQGSCLRSCCVGRCHVWISRCCPGYYCSAETLRWADHQTKMVGWRAYEVEIPLHWAVVWTHCNSCWNVCCTSLKQALWKAMAIQHTKDTVFRGALEANITVVAPWCCAKGHAATFLGA